MHRNADPTVRLLAALADPVRLDIVRQLSLGEEVCACDFDVHPKVAQSTVSHHLRVLREAGVIRSERHGTFIHYSLETAAIERLATLVRSLKPPALDASTPGAGRRLPARAAATETRVTSGR
jgi:ArsR family transcriptional regulator